MGILASKLRDTLCRSRYSESSIDYLPFIKRFPPQLFFRFESIDLPALPLFLLELAGVGYDWILAGTVWDTARVI